MEMNDETFTFHWKIKNLAYNTLENGEALHSPEFIIPRFHYTKWCLGLRPKGLASEHLGYMSFFVRRNFDSGPDTVFVKYDVYVALTGIGFSDQIDFEKGMGKGRDEFFPLNSPLCNDNSIVIVIKMCCNHVKLREAKRKFPVELQADLQTIGAIKEEFERPANPLTLGATKSLISPAQCFSQSLICVNKVHFEWMSKKGFMDEIKLRQVVPLVVASNCPYLLVNLTKAGHDEYLSIDINLVDINIYTSLLIVCKLRIWLCSNEFITLPERQHTFHPGRGDETWYFYKSIFIPDLRSNNSSTDTLKWEFEFSFANGEIRQDILWEKVLNETTDHSTVSLPNGLRSYCEQNELRRDIILNVENKMFMVNKLLLTSMSPVFSSMFDGNLAENTHSSVDIEDFDVSTVNEFLYFLYNGVCTKLSCDKTQRLFAMANKYKVSQLMDLCRTCIIGQLGYHNACDILAFAEVHSDTVLKEAAVKLIWFNKENIINSRQWKIFENKYQLLAYDILKEIYLNHD